MKIGFSIFISFIFLFLLLETLGFFIFEAIPDRFTFITPESFVLKDEEIEKNRNAFNRELGWGDHTYRHRPSLPKNLIAAFGDSYTYGSQVQEEETWAFYLQKLINANVLNFGNGGYGPGQALLKFEKIKNKLDTKIIFLAMTSEMLKRAVNNYRPFYFPKTGIKLTKPRFRVSESEVILDPNPINSSNELSKLADPRFIDEIGDRDFWYQYDNLPKKQFPYSRLLLNNNFWDEIYHGKADDMNSQALDIWSNDQSLMVFQHIIDRFILKAKKQFIPVLIFIPRREDIERYRDYNFIIYQKSYNSICNKKYLYCIDLTQKTAIHINTQDLDLFYRGHPTPRLHSFFATLLFENLKSLNLIKD